MISGRRTLAPFRLPVGAILMALALAGTPGEGEPPIALARADLVQAPTCAWASGARMPQSLFSMASAYDGDEQVMYLFGGLNKDFAVQSFMQAIDFSAATDPGDGATSTRRAGTARLFGATAFYRPSTEADEKGTVYVLFGSKDPGTPAGTGAVGGRGENTVYAYDIETNAWRVVATSGVALGERLFAAAEYDPVNDVAVVTGGVKKCSIAEALDGSPCVADAFETLILSFNETGDISAARGPAGGPRTVHSHTMVYDPTNGRMLVHGGTTNGTATLDATWALDMGDLSGLAWGRVSAGGGPSVAGHSAAYWPPHEWLVVHGGAANAPATNRENVSTRTNALRFDPAGAGWTDLGATTSPTERMGASAEYVDTGPWQAVVVAGGRTRFDARGSSVAADYTSLTCGDSPGATVTPIVPTATPDPGGATPTFTPEIPIPGPSATPTSPATSTPTPPPAHPDAMACPRLDIKVPRAVIDAALANPAAVAGWGHYCWHHLKPSPFNQLRRALDITNPNKPYHPMYNPLVFKCGCL